MLAKSYEICTEVAETTLPSRQKFRITSMLQKLDNQIDISVTSQNPYSSHVNGTRFRHDYVVIPGSCLNMHSPDVSTPLPRQKHRSNMAHAVQECCRYFTNIRLLPGLPE